MPVAGQRTHGPTFRVLKVTLRVVASGQSLRSMTVLLFIALRQGGPKSGPQTHGHHSVKSESIKIFAGRLLGKFAVKWTLKIPPILETFIRLTV